jgi:hypothetical protein
MGLKLCEARIWEHGSRDRFSAFYCGVTPQRKVIMITEYLTVANAAHEVGLSYRQMANYVQEGKVPSEWMGHIRILKRTDVQTFKNWHAANGGRWPR